MARIFLSYRRDDSAGFAGRLADAMEAEFGAGSVFRDVDDIRPGEDFIHAIETHLQQVGVVLVMIGPRWLDAGAGPMPWRLPGYEIAARAPERGCCRFIGLQPRPAPCGCSHRKASPSSLQRQARRERISKRGRVALGPMLWRLHGHEIAARAPLPQAGGRLFRHAHMPSFQDRLSNRSRVLFEVARLR